MNENTDTQQVGPEQSLVANAMKYIQSLAEQTGAGRQQQHQESQTKSAQTREGLSNIVSNMKDLVVDGARFALKGLRHLPLGGILFGALDDSLGEMNNGFNQALTQQER